MNVEEIGLVGWAVAEKGYGKTVHITNDVGGTSSLPPGRYRVRVVHGFDDYETGRVLHGELLDEKDIETARRTGTTGYAKKGLVYRPVKVYFYSDNFEQDHGR